MVEPRQFAGLDDVLARALERGEPPFVLVMDSLEDPQNVGTLLRSAEAAGVHGVLFPTHRQAPLSPAAIKASAGAVEHLLLCPVDDLPGALSDLRIRGLRIAAAEADAPLTTAQADLRGPLAIVVGSEGQGLSPNVRRRADVAVRIPMRGAIGSLNAAVAGSILLFAAVAQRDPGGDGAPERQRPRTFDEISAGSSGEPDASASGAEARVSAAEPAVSAAEPRAAAEPNAAAKGRAAAGPKAAAEPKAAAKRKRAATTGKARTGGAQPVDAIAEPEKPTARRAKATADLVAADGPVPPEPGPKPAAKPRRTRVAAATPEPATPESAGKRPAKGRQTRAKAVAPVEPEPGPDELLPGGPPPD